MRVSVTFGGLEADDALNSWTRFDLVGEPAALEAWHRAHTWEDAFGFQRFESALEDEYGKLDVCLYDEDVVGYQAHECPDDRRDDLIQALRTWFVGVGGVGIGPTYHVGPPHPAGAPEP